jgi:hypothetical protein
VTPNARTDSESLRRIAARNCSPKVAIHSYRHNVVIGVDLWYLRHYEGLAFGSFTGDAVYPGPTFFWKIGPKTLVSASYEAQITGRQIGGASPLNLTDFSRQRARLLFEFEFEPAARNATVDHRRLRKPDEQLPTERRMPPLGIAGSKKASPTTTPVTRR